MTTPATRPLTPRPAPPPGLAILRHRLADRPDLRDALLAAIAETRDPTGTGDPPTTVGTRLDVAGDPTLLTVAELWARVADSVDAYTELAAGERYLGTAQDWTDLRRTVDLLGHRPAQRTAARGWLRAEIHGGGDTLLPAGTRVQAPGTEARPAQTYEVAADTPLRADWAGLTVTAVPRPTAPTGASLRFLADPHLGPGDRVLLVQEDSSAPAMPTTWGTWLSWHELVLAVRNPPTSVVAAVTIAGTASDLGTTLVETDRDLTTILRAVPGRTHAAYRVRATLELARRLSRLSYVTATGAAADAAVSYGSEPSAVTAHTLLVADASMASPGLGIIVHTEAMAHVTTVRSVGARAWSVAPGTQRTVGELGLSAPLPVDLVTGDVTITLVDPRVPALHHELPDLAPGVRRLRIHPRPARAPERLAVRTTAGWESSPCAVDPQDTPEDAGGMLLVLEDGLAGAASTAPGTANLAVIRHGETRTEPLTLDAGTALLAGPVAADVDAAGRVRSSLLVRVGGIEFTEVRSLYGRGPAERVFTTRLAADGRLLLRFGDDVHGAAPRGPVVGTWRIGGGLVGELDGALIDTLVGTVRGVRRVGGVGPLSAAADQEDPLTMRSAAAARIRALDRVVGLEHLADVALTMPGTSHAVSWRGPGPRGCACGGSGLHLAVLRRAATGVRAPSSAELTALAGFLDARRDTTVPLCVCAGAASGIALALRLATDPARERSAVESAVLTSLTDPEGPLCHRRRRPGVPLDASDVAAIAHAVPGLVGIISLELTGGLLPPVPGGLGRTPAARHEVLGVTSAVAVTP